MVDERLRILWEGTTAADLAASSGELEEPLASEVLAIVRMHDFAISPVAVGLLDTTFELSVSLSSGLAGAQYTISCHRTLLGKRLRAVVACYGLDPADADLLRLFVGGYPLVEIARRHALSAVAARERIRRLEATLGCRGREEFIALVARREPRAVIASQTGPLGAPSRFVVKADTPIERRIAFFGPAPFRGEGTARASR